MTGSGPLAQLRLLLAAVATAALLVLATHSRVNGAPASERDNVRPTTRPAMQSERDRAPAEAERTLDPAAPQSALPAAPEKSHEKDLINRKGKPTSRPSAKSAAARPTADGFEVKRVLIALSIVIVLILALRWFGRKFFGVAGGGRSTRTIQVLSRSPLSPRQQVVLVRVGRRLLVLADSGGQMSTLSEITDPDEVAALIGQLQDDHADRVTTTFGNLFGRMRAPFERQAAADEEADGRAVVDAEELPSRGRRMDDERATAAAANDPAVESTRQELSGLMDKVRMLSRQFK